MARTNSMSFEAALNRRWDLGALARDLAGGKAAAALAPYLLALALAIAAHVFVVLWDEGTSLEGGMHGTDGYLRLVRVEALWNSGDWYETVLERNNAPYGLAMHWTRPMDVLLIAGGAALTPWMEFRDGLYLWAFAISPVLHIAMILALIWAMTPLLSIPYRCLIGPALLLQVPLLSTGLAARPDHHMLIALAFVVALGANLRLIMRPAAPRLGLAAGASLGLCLWLTMEGLVVLAACLAVAGGLWVLKGGDRAVRCLWQALGLAALLVLALLAERPPGDWLSDEYDRVSVVHLLLAVLIAGFWFAVVLLERLRGQDPRWLLRGGVGALGAGLSAVILFACFPKFFGGPEVDTDPIIQTIFFDWVSELEPLAPWDARGLQDLLTYIGPAVIAVPFYLALLSRGTGGKEWDGWFLVALCAGLFLLLAIAMRRFAPLAEVFLAIPVAVVLVKVLDLTERISEAVRRVGVRCLAILALLFGPQGLAQALPVKSPVAFGGGACSLDRIAPFLNDPAGLGDRQRVILAHFNHGSELLYRTGHAVVASPYHRNTAGLLDTHEAFGSEGDAAAREVATRRGIDLVLLCRDGPALHQFVRVNDKAFVLRLVAEDQPAWLEPVTLPEALARDFLLFEVKPEAR